MGLFGPECQSCGMPLKRDEKGGGTNVDGSVSAEYCSHCWQDGKFVRPELDVEQMKQIVREKMVAMGVPKFVARILSRNVPKLNRWAKV